MKPAPATIGPLLLVLWAMFCATTDAYPIQPLRFLPGQGKHPQWPPLPVDPASSREWPASSALATLTASPSVISDGGSVTVEWQNVANPAALDWIAIYCGTKEGANATNVLDWTRVPTVGARGTYTFANLVNMRCQYYFRYYQDVSGGYLLVAESNNVTVGTAGISAPHQGRVSLTGRPGEVVVTWTTANSKHQPAVKYGLTAGNYSTTVQGTDPGVTYAASDMCGSPATEVGQALFRQPGYFYSVLLTNLAPGAYYFYRFGSDSDGWSPEFRLRAPRAASADSGVAFIAYGDMGVGGAPAAAATASLVAKELTDTAKGYDYVLHFGDISYALGAGYVWEQFHFLVEPVATAVPYMVSIGNHEYDHTTGGENDPSGAPGTGFHPSWGNYGDDSYGECSVPTHRRFRSPTNGHGLYWYSFDLGNAHVVQLSSEHDYTPSAPQYGWLAADLAAVNRSRTPFVVVTAHRPMYESENYPGDFEVAANMRKAFEDVLYKYKVDLFLGGHYHAYERTCVVYNEKCVADGTLHVTVGTAGASLDSVSYIPEPWHVVGRYDFGYLRVSADRHQLRGEYILNKDGSTADTWTIHTRFQSAYR